MLRKGEKTHTVPWGAHMEEKASKFSMEKWGKLPIWSLFLLLSCFSGSSHSIKPFLQKVFDNSCFALVQGKLLLPLSFILRLDERHHSSALFSGKGSLIWCHIPFSWMSSSISSNSLPSLDFLQDLSVSLIRFFPLWIYLWLSMFCLSSAMFVSSAPRHF